MILNVLKNSLTVPTQVIPVESLLGSCGGSRMPAVQARELTPESATRGAEACPTEALRLEARDGRPHLCLDYGLCIGCGRCIEAAPAAFVAADGLHRAGVSREALVRTWDLASGTEVEAVEEPASGAIFAALGRALNIRQLDAGSCNGCEAEITALTNPYYDLERFGIHFVASPKHADMLLVTGPVTRNMAQAVRNTYEAVPHPKLVIATGACAISGGLFAGSHAVVGPVDSVIPVDGYIPGCPPTPAMLVTGILEVLRRRVR